MGLAKAARCFDAGPLRDLVVGPQTRPAEDMPPSPTLALDDFDKSMLRYDPRSFVYTDGSRLTENNGERVVVGIGAAVIDYRRRVATHVDPVALDSLMMTINRAELVAMYQAFFE